MTTLFVDIDDTLILWHDPEPVSTRWDLNLAVVECMYAWEEEIVIWSSGGAAYAETMARQALREYPDLLERVSSFEAKFMRLAAGLDVFLDDAPWTSFRHASIHPAELLV